MAEHEGRDVLIAPECDTGHMTIPTQSIWAVEDKAPVVRTLIVDC